MKNKHLLLLICVVPTISLNVSAQKPKSNKSVQKISTSKTITSKPPLIKSTVIQTARPILAKQNSKVVSAKQISIKDDDEFKAPFRYVIVKAVSESEKHANEGLDPKDDFLDLEVLMEDGAFTEDNLIILHDLLNKRFAKFGALYVWVYTSLDAIRTPEENDRLDQKSPIENLLLYKSATLARNGRGEWIDYSIPGGNTNEIVWLKEGKEHQ